MSEAIELSPLAAFERQVTKRTLYRNDLFAVEDWPEWKQQHPLGPVHFQFRCNICREVVLTDSEECDFTDTIWQKLYPHVLTHA